MRWLLGGWNSHCEWGGSITKHQLRWLVRSCRQFKRATPGRERKFHLTKTDFFQKQETQGRTHCFSVKPESKGIGKGEMIKR